MRFAPRPTLTALAAALLGTLALPAAATNGMNLEAYGAKAGGMGGASFAYENGNSALMNNPATLGLRQDWMAASSRPAFASRSPISIQARAERLFSLSACSKRSRAASCSPLSMAATAN